MLRPRIIPCLLVHDGGLVKTVNFAQPTYVGDPINAVRIFNEKAVDELIVVDIDASRSGRGPDFKLVGDLAAECRMPLCYGGGVTTAQEAKRAVSLGAEKVAVSAAAVSDPRLLTRMADAIGRQSVVAVLDVRRAAAGDGTTFEVWTHGGTRLQHHDALELAQTLQDAGAGEIVVNSIDRDGTMQGYDLDLARRARQAISVPLTVLGGAGNVDHVLELVRACGIVGAAAGSLFVFKGQLRAVLINYPSPAQRDGVSKAALELYGG